MDFSAFRSSRTWWIIGAVIVVALIALLAAIAGQQPPSLQDSPLAPGESERLYARVVEVLEEGTIDQGEFQQPYQQLRLRITDGALSDLEIDVEHGMLGLTNQSRLLHAGDRVLVDHMRTLDGEDVFFIADFVRTAPLLWLALLFVATTILLNGW